ncbi:hypothetical protein [Streptomyces caniscabiei]|uniref:hypothetical protein n=1 Tax=Streptomyces caniscabiei TaxID=2746961 RepID=UPI0038F79612
MTEKLLRPLRTRPWPERWLTRLLGAALAAAAYRLCLPWDLRDRPELEGSFTKATPVTVTGVVVLALVLLLLAAYFGHRDALAWPLLLVAVPPSALMYVAFHAHTEPPDAAVWPLSWAFFTLVQGAWVLVVSSVARRFRTDPVDERWLIHSRSQDPSADRSVGRSAAGQP